MLEAEGLVILELILMLVYMAPRPPGSGLHGEQLDALSSCGLLPNYGSSFQFHLSSCTTDLIILSVNLSFTHSFTQEIFTVLYQTLGIQ